MLCLQGINEYKWIFEGQGIFRMLQLWMPAPLLLLSKTFQALDKVLAIPDYLFLM